MNILQDKAAVVAEHVQISGIKRKATYISKPSRVLLLKNMIKTSEIDEELKTELSLEFKKFGDVISMVVYAVDKKSFPNCPGHEEVRIFVHYERQDYAIRAWKDMNGRYFGGRKVSVEYFPESKFVSSELEPGNDEW
jgi:splicing factor 45